MITKCSQCKGLCCRRIGQFQFMKIYDRGDGVCKYLTEENKCEIYDHRPLICNTDRLYELFYVNKITREEYDRLNDEACEQLKRLYNEKEERDGRSQNEREQQDDGSRDR